MLRVTQNSLSSRPRLLSASSASGSEVTSKTPKHPLQMGVREGWPIGRFACLPRYYGRVASCMGAGREPGVCGASADAARYDEYDDPDGDD